MTKAKVKEIYNSWRDNISNEIVKADEAKKELEQLAKEYTNHCCCSYFDNFKYLIGTKGETRAMMLYNQIMVAEGLEKAHIDLAIATGNMNI